MGQFMGRSNIITWTGLVACVVPAGLLMAQSSYGGPGRIWWDAGVSGVLGWDEDYDNASGRVGIRNTLGAVRTAGHPFFEALGVNGRACITCHQPSNAMGLSVATVRERWTETGGKDPLFAAIDGSNCPSLPQDAKESHSLLLDRGLFRIALAWPPTTVNGIPVTPDFQIEVIRDPTGCNTSSTYGLASAKPSISVYRRPRIAANFNTVAAAGQGFTFMADGREPSLFTQATSAILTHEQAVAPPSKDQLQQIVDFESQLYAGQSSDLRGGLMYEEHGPLLLGPENVARGRAGNLSVEEPDARLVWKSFDVWKANGSAAEIGVQRGFRASVARGSLLFAARKFHIQGSAEATCATCHAAGVYRWMDIGTTNHSVAEAAPDLPLFKVICNKTGQVIYTQDPGRALISGKCVDVGAIVIQQLRGLPARAPYFTNGSAATLRGVVDFYDKRFNAGFTEAEKRDLTNFLSAL